LELKFAAKEKALESEVNQHKNKAQELEKILKKNRKNEQNLKEELVKANNQVLLQKQSFDQSIFKLQNENKTLKETLSYKTNSLQNKISEATRDLNEFKSLYESSEKENETLRYLNDSLSEKLDELKNVRNELEQEKMKHQEAAMKIKELEYQVNSFGDWKEVERASTSRMSGMSDMEKEVTRLRQVNKSLHDAMGNKLLLEEQVHSLKTRLERYEKSSEDQIILKTKIDSVEKELDDWKQLGLDFVNKGSAPNPINVRNYVEKLLHRDLQLVSEKSSASSEKSTIQNELGDLRIVSVN
jgi:mitotic spindle assembly checkpoint protein MAD1